MTGPAIALALAVLAVAAALFTMAWIDRGQDEQQPATPRAAALPGRPQQPSAIAALRREVAGRAYVLLRAEVVLDSARHPEAGQ